jgi:hypothetical protein
MRKPAVRSKQRQRSAATVALGPRNATLQADSSCRRTDFDAAQLTTGREIYTVRCNSSDLLDIPGFTGLRWRLSRFWAVAATSVAHDGLPWRSRALSCPLAALELVASPSSGRASAVIVSRI